MILDTMRWMRKPLPLVDCCAPIVRRLSEKEAVELERLLRTLADRHRIKIVSLLVAAGRPLCVCELVPALKIKQPTVSYHLKQLTEAGILERERRGTFVYYRLRRGVLDAIGYLFRAPALV